ncbi:MAG: YHS domain protein [Blastocatellia bacterium]|nr:YHS domain protein [Blastocatellia bacterium]
MVVYLAGMIGMVVVVTAVVLFALTGPVRGYVVKATVGIDPVNKTSAGVALKGYDAVAYFQEGKAVPGTKEFVFEWNSAEWRFSSAENRDLFAKSPEKYAPQYGGYCAWAVSRGYTADGDPKTWKVVDGKLYLNYNATVGKDWEKDIPGNITNADKNWPKLVNK